MGKMQFKNPFAVKPKQDRIQKDFTISRQSVCLADDMEDHTITYTIGSDTRFSDVFRDLIKRKYFPNIAGNDVVWTLFCGDDNVMSWKTKKNKLYGRRTGKEPAILSVKLWAEAGEIYFKYDSRSHGRV